MVIATVSLSQERATERDATAAMRRRLDEIARRASHKDNPYANAIRADHFKALANFASAVGDRIRYKFEAGRELLNAGRTEEAIEELSYVKSFLDARPGSVENPGADAVFLTLELEGRKSNRYGVDSRIHVDVTSPAPAKRLPYRRERRQLRWLNAQAGDRSGQARKDRTARDSMARLRYRSKLQRHRSQPVLPTRGRRRPGADRSAFFRSLAPTSGPHIRECRP